MRSSNIILIAFIAGLSFTACEMETENDSQTLANTAWKLVEVRNSKPSEVLTYPTSEYPYIIEFMGSRTVNFPRHCNYLRGYYTADESGIIAFEYFGNGTEIYCPGITEWEMQVVSNLQKAEKYQLSSDKLTITCGTTKLVFKSFVQKDNPLSNSEWRIDPNYLGLDEKVNEYSLYVESDDIYSWGNFVRFFSDGTFCSFDTQFCGNSCFTNVYGKYSMPADNVLTISVDSVNFNCSGAGGENKTEIRNGNEITFKISDFNKNGLQLKKK
jgi:heat shock protein HslJ